MPWPHVVAALVMALLAAAGAWFAPAVLARLPEPPPPDEPGTEQTGTEHETDGTVRPDAPPVPDKIPYADLAARRGLSPRLGLAAGVAGAGVGAALGPSASLPLWLFLVVLGVLLTYVDWTTRLLPFLLVAPAYPVTVLLVVLASLGSGDWSALLRSAIAWAAVYALFTLMWFLYRRGLGYGDVRLSGLLGMSLGWLGWTELLVGLYAAFLLGAVIGGILVLAKVVDRRGYAFGPFMLVGAWVGVVLPPALALL